MHASYQWGIGSAENLTVPDMMDWRMYDHWHIKDCVDIPLNHSQKYYNYVKAYNKALNARSTQIHSDGSKRVPVRLSLWGSR